MAPPIGQPRARLHAPRKAHRGRRPPRSTRPTRRSAPPHWQCAAPRSAAIRRPSASKVSSSRCRKDRTEQRRGRPGTHHTLLPFARALPKAEALLPYDSLAIGFHRPAWDCPGLTHAAALPRALVRLARAYGGRVLQTHGAGRVADRGGAGGRSHAPRALRLSCRCTEAEQIIALGGDGFLLQTLHEMLLAARSARSSG
jgi:hypothetical protein